MIKIYRFGNYINAVDSKAELAQWIRDNVPPGEQDQCSDHYFLSDCYELPELMMIAGRQNYVFKANKVKRQSRKAQ